MDRIIPVPHKSWTFYKHLQFCTTSKLVLQLMKEKMFYTPNRDFYLFFSQVMEFQGQLKLCCDSKYFHFKVTTLFHENYFPTKRREFLVFLPF